MRQSELEERQETAPSAGKIGAGLKRGKIYLSQVSVGVGFAPDWLEKNNYQKRVIALIG